MSTEHVLDDGIKSIKDAWQREHTARCILERMLENIEAENAKLRKLCVDLHKLADESYVPFMAENKWMDELADIERRMRGLGIGVE